MRILVVSTNSHPGHERRNLRVAKELIARGFKVMHTGPSKRMNVGFFVWSCFPLDFETQPEARAANTRLFHQWQELFEMIAWADIVLFGTGKGYGDAGKLAQRLGKLVIQHHDVGGLDPHHCHPDVFFARGPWDADSLTARSLPLALPPIVTGCVQFDEAYLPEFKMSREVFCDKYGLDPGRKILTYLSCSPIHHRQSYLEKQKQIIDAAVALGFQVVVKPHPSDYAGAKIDRSAYVDNMKSSWLQFGAPLTVVEPFDKYTCFFHSDIIVSRGSTTALETPLVGKPMLMIEMGELAVDSNHDSTFIKSCWPWARFTSIRRRDMHPLGVNGHRLDLWPEGPALDSALDLCEVSRNAWGIDPEYIGDECTIEEFPRILSSGAHLFENAGIYRSYLDRYHPFSDGKSHVRVADAIEAILEHPITGAKV
ncbi:MAG: hypothetical protein EPN26_03775, partial [Rhodospirillales bacterium]